jgi:hypothetical protein
MRNQVNVNLIRAFEGPRHTRLERLWLQFPIPRIYVHDNRTTGLSHGEALNAMWAEEKKRQARYAIFTEFDFLPGPEFLRTEMAAPLIAGEYCTRNPETLKEEWHGIPGAWFIMVDKKFVPRSLDFGPGGPFNDPGALLPAALIQSYDCMPEHYGVRVGTRGEHLFFSRHYNDEGGIIAGLDLADILSKVDRKLTQVEQDVHD